MKSVWDFREYSGPRDPSFLREMEELEILEQEWEMLQSEGEINRRSREYIRWVQQSLNRILGVRLVQDGKLGLRTRNAICIFQQRAGLSVDGVPGSRTDAALRSAGASSPPSRSSSIPRSAPTAVNAPDIVNVRGIRVAREIADQVDALLAAAQADGISLSGGGYRPIEVQIELRRQHCGSSHYDIWEKPSRECTPPTATPGHSMHERGLAIDFKYNGRGIGSHDNPGYQWLARNAARFGLKNLPSEPWHWSVSGR